MLTRNILPCVDNEGTVGSSSKTWAEGRFYDLYCKGTPWIDVRIYGETTGFALAVAAIGSTSSVLYIPNEQSVTGDVTVPATLTLKFSPGGFLNIATTKTVTINGNIDAGLTKIFSCAGTGKVVFGAGAVKEVYAEWWGNNTTPGTTDMTAALKSALATGENVFMLNTTYGHTGGLQQSTMGQAVRGVSKKFISLGGSGTVLKKLSGTLVGYEMGSHNGTLEDITFDNNALAGSALKPISHYMTVRNITINRQGGTDFGMTLESVNTSYFENITFSEDCYGAIKASGTDALLYSEFHNVVIGIVTGPYAIDLENASNNSFYDLICESPMIIRVASENNNFYNFVSETRNPASLITITGTVRGVNFWGGRVWVYDARILPLINIISAKNVHFEGFFVKDLISDVPIIFSLDGTMCFSAKNFSVYSANVYDFVKCNSAGGNNTYPALENVYSVDGAIGTNRWLSTYMDIRNSNLHNIFYAGSVGAVNMTNIMGTINTANISADAPVILTGCVGAITDADNLAKIIPDISETISAAGALSVSKNYSKLTTAAGAMAVTLADGRWVGEIKNIVLVTDGGDATLTVAKHRTSSPEVFTFNDAGDTLTLMWSGLVWITIENVGVAA